MENSNTTNLYINLCELPARYYKKIYTHDDDENNPTINDKDVIFFNKILSTDFNYGKTIIIERRSLLEYFKEVCRQRNGRDLFGRTIKLQFKFRSDSVFNIVSPANDLVKQLSIQPNSNTTFIPINMVANCSGDRFTYLSNSVADFDVESSGNALEIIEPLTILTEDSQGNEYKCIVPIGAEFETLKSDILVNLANKGLDDLTTHEFRAMNVSHNDTLNTVDNIDYAFMNDKYLQLLACYNVLLMSTGNIRALEGIIKWFGYKNPKQILKVVRKWHPVISNFEKDTDGMLETEKRFEHNLEEIDKFTSYGTTNLYNLVLDLSQLNTEITSDIDKTYRWRMYLLGLFMEAHFLPIHLNFDYSGVRENVKSDLNNDKTGNFKVFTNSHLYSGEYGQEFGYEKNGTVPKIDFKVVTPPGKNGKVNKDKDVSSESSKVLDQLLKNREKNNNHIHLKQGDINYMVVNYDKNNGSLVDFGKPTKYSTKITGAGLVGAILNLGNSPQKIKNIRFFGSDYKTEHTGIYSFADTKDFKQLFVNYRTKYIRISFKDSSVPQSEYIVNYSENGSTIKSNFNHSIISGLLHVFYIDEHSKKNEENIIQNFSLKQITTDFSTWFKVADLSRNPEIYTTFKNLPDYLTVPVYKSRTGKMVRLSKPGLSDEKEINTFYDAKSTRIFTPLFFNMISSEDYNNKENKNKGTYGKIKGILISLNGTADINHTFKELKWKVYSGGNNQPEEYVTTSILLYNKGINKVELTGFIDGIEISWSSEFFI